MKMNSEFFARHWRLLPGRGRVVPLVVVVRVLRVGSVEKGAYSSYSYPTHRTTTWTRWTFEGVRNPACTAVVGVDLDST